MSFLPTYDQVRVCAYLAIFASGLLAIEQIAIEAVEDFGVLDLPSNATTTKRPTPNITLATTTEKQLVTTLAVTTRPPEIDRNHLIEDWCGNCTRFGNSSFYKIIVYSWQKPQYVCSPLPYIFSRYGVIVDFG